MGIGVVVMVVAAVVMVVVAAVVTIGCGAVVVGNWVVVVVAIQQVGLNTAGKLQPAAELGPWTIYKSPTVVSAERSPESTTCIPADLD